MGEIKLDAKDKKILAQLDMDARQSNTTIAKKVGLSREVVAYRLKKLSETHVIDGYYTVINCCKLGYMYSRLCIKFKHVDPDKEKEIIEYVTHHKDIGWTTTYSGEYDLIISIWSKTISDFEDVFDDLNDKYGKFFLRRHVIVATKIYHYKHNYLYGTKDNSVILFGGRIVNNEIDDIDFKILHYLAADARIPLLELSEKIGITPKSISTRIKKMQEANIILGYRAKLNLKRLGFQHIKVFLRLQDLNDKNYSRLLTYFKFHPSIIYAVKAISQEEIEIELVAKGNEEYDDIMQGLRYQFSDLIVSYRSTQMLRTHQINYLPCEICPNKK